MKSKPDLCKHYKRLILQDLAENRRSKASAIAERTGIPLRVASNLLKYMRLSGHVRIGKVDQCNRSLWERAGNNRIEDDEATANRSNAFLAHDPEHKAWMDYWRRRRQERLARAQGRPTPPEPRP